MNIAFTLFSAWTVTQRLQLEIPAAIKAFDVSNISDYVVAKLDFWNNRFSLSVYTLKSREVTTTEDEVIYTSEEGDLVFSAKGATFDEIHDALHRWVTVDYPKYLDTIDVAEINQNITQLKSRDFKECQMALADETPYKLGFPFSFSQIHKNHKVKYYVVKTESGKCAAKVLRIDPL